MRIMLESAQMSHEREAHVENGRIVVDAPTNLPEGHELKVQMNEDEMSDEEREALHASILRGIADGEAGREMDAEDFLRQLASEP